MNELINDEAVYRTAPATPGLLNIKYYPDCRTPPLPTLIHILKNFKLKI